MYQIEKFLNDKNIINKENLLFFLVIINQILAHGAILFFWRYPTELTIIITLLLLIQFKYDDTVSKMYVIIFSAIPLVYQPTHIYLSNLLTNGNGWTWNAPNFFKSITWLSPLFGLCAFALIHLERFVIKYLET